MKLLKVGTKVIARGIFGEVIAYLKSTDKPQYLIEKPNGEHFWAQYHDVKEVST